MAKSHKHLPLCVSVGSVCDTHEFRAPGLNNDKPRGRGAGNNPANRYHAHDNQAFDDGWQQEPVAPLRTEVTIDRSRKAITYNQSPDIPFDRSINPYRGCEHGCIYCYARPTHAWLDLSPGLDFESRLFARPDLPEQLVAELNAPQYRPAPLALGAITDAYQPIERDWLVTRRVLEILADKRHPTVIVTKSSLVERDTDLLHDMAEQQLVEVAISLTTLHRPLARQLEPRAAAPQRRLQVIECLSKAGIPVRAMIAPLIPVLTEPEIENLLRAAADAGATAANYVLMRLPLEVSPLFRDWLDTHYPDSAKHVMQHVQALRAGRDNDSTFGQRLVGTGVYADMIRQRFQLARRKLHLDAEIELRSDLFRPPPSTGQLDLF